MSPLLTTLIEWGATLLSLLGCWLCIRRHAICFVVFSVADVGWLTTAWMNSHTTLFAQQILYLILNIVGYLMWTRDGRLRQELPVERSAESKIVIRFSS